MTELLAADHLKPVEQPGPRRGARALQRARPDDRALRRRADALPARRASAARSRPRRRSPAGARWDASSPVFLVDHSACILCERCIRACDEVQQNHVIGRTGKGPNAGIGFDLNDPMGESSCVKCGECMVSCPTSAITFKPVGADQARRRTTARAEVAPGARADLPIPSSPASRRNSCSGSKGLVIRSGSRPARCSAGRARRATPRSSSRAASSR